MGNGFEPPPRRAGCGDVVVVISSGVRAMRRSRMKPTALANLVMDVVTETSHEVTLTIQEPPSVPSERTGPLQREAV